MVVVNVCVFTVGFVVIVDYLFYGVVSCVCCLLVL